MTNKEIEMLTRFMATSKCYFEWGSGASTKLACEAGIPKIYSVESDINWFKMIKSECPDACINYVDIDADGSSYSHPKSDRKSYNFKTYNQFILLVDYTPDLVLVDGRFRVLCASSVYSALDEDDVMLVHDYKAREYYHDIELFFDIVVSADSLFAFKKKPWGGSPHSDMYNILCKIDDKFENDVR